MGIFDNENAIEAKRIENLVARIRKDQDDLQEAIRTGQVLTLTAAGKLIESSRQNFSSAVRAGELETFRIGSQVFTTLAMLKSWRASLRFHRKGHAFMEANSDNGHAVG